MILYFTGTGNSKYVAESLGKILGDKVVSVNNMMREEMFGTVESSKPFVFVFPIYAWRMPKVLSHWIKRASLVGNKEAYFVGTCGDDAGNAEKYIKQLSDAKNFSYKGTAYVKMPNNYITMFTADDDEMEEKKLKTAKRKIKTIAEIIKTDKTFPQTKTNAMGKINSSVVNTTFYGTIVKDKAFYAKDTCTSCGECEEICPLRNITMQGGKPKWNGNCTHCMGCISICPVEVIEYGDKTEGKKRYYFKDKTEDLK